MKFETARLTRQELHDLVGNAIVPLPVALISTIGPNGVPNAAPFSFVVPLVSKPPIVGISFGLMKGQKKTTLKNIEFAQDFVINVVDEPILKQAVKSADYEGEDKIKGVGLTAVKSDKVKSPRIAESKVSLECRLVQKLELIEEGTGLRGIVLGEVLVAHVDDSVWVNGQIDPSRLKAIGRVGRDAYCRTGDVFNIKRPPMK